MRRLNLFLAGWLVFAPFAASCTADPVPADPKTETPDQQTETPGQKEDDKMFPAHNEEVSMSVTITAGGKSFAADIEDSETGRAFMKKLPLTLDMSELNGNEKYCYGMSLPENDRHYDSLSSGDLMLYGGNCVVLFYGPAGGYSYTRIGRIADPAGLASALGSGSVSVRFK